MISFDNKKIIITGATGGIGNELVKKFISLKGNVLATGTNDEKLEKLKKEYPDVEILKFDISKHSEIENFIENASSKIKGLDIFGEWVTFNFDKHEKNITTVTGGVLSIIIIITVSLYMYQQTYILFENKKGVEFTASDFI